MAVLSQWPFYQSWKNKPVAAMAVLSIRSEWPDLWIRMADFILSSLSTARSSQFKKELPKQVAALSDRPAAVAALSKPAKLLLNALIKLLIKRLILSLLLAQLLIKLLIKLLAKLLMKLLVLLKLLIKLLTKLLAKLLMKLLVLLKLLIKLLIKLLFKLLTKLLLKLHIRSLDKVHKEDSAVR